MGPLRLKNLTQAVTVILATFDLSLFDNCLHLSGNNLQLLT